MKERLMDMSSVEPFLFWRYSAIGAFAAALILAAIPATRFASLWFACLIPAIGWALCDVYAERDRQRIIGRAIAKDCQHTPRHASWGTLMWLQCPGCGSNLCCGTATNDDTLGVEIPCWNCAQVSLWDFDHPAPILKVAEVA